MPVRAPDDDDRRHDRERDGDERGAHRDRSDALLAEHPSSMKGPVWECKPEGRLR
jgi:hypothetical protein